jgi:hypothetical protein
MSTDIAFFQQKSDLYPISFFKWKNYRSQEDKKNAHSAYASLITKAQSMAAWKGHAVLLKYLWKKAQVDGTISQFWRALPNHSSTQRIQKIQVLWLCFLICDLCY